MKSKRIIITGCSRGIGFELVKILAGHGHEVLAISRNISSLEKLKSGPGRIYPWQAQITKAEGCNSIIEFIRSQWGQADVLIHNAGALVNAPFEQTTIELFKQVYEVNVFAVAELTRVLIPLMSDKGHVVTISSMGGIQGSVKFAGLSAYSSSKGAVITLMELLAEEFKDRGISFNTLALGAVQTEMLQEAFPDYQAQTSATEMAEYIADFALNRNGLFNGKVVEVSNSTP